jgi:hypothetical protein
MSQADFWYVRFPDGRILRAASTAILRQELHAGHIPLASTVRRTPSDEWVSLEWTQEFAEVVEELASRAPPAKTEARRPQSSESREALQTYTEQPATVGSRLDAARLNLVGIRGYLDELLAALDAALVPHKLLVGLIAGLLVGSLFALWQAAWFEQDNRWRASAWSLLAVGIVLFDILAGLLTRLTFVELARLRPSRWRDGFTGLGPLTVWIVVSQLIVRGAAWGLIVLLRWLPFWLGPGPDEPWTVSQQILAGTALALGMVVEALLWPIFFFWWQMPPLLVVEECTVWRGLSQWASLLRRHLGRVFLYQAMAIGIGLVLTAPFLLLIAPLFLPSFYPPPELRDVVSGTHALLLGLACAPFWTYWVTANVFIYLNLRYGATHRH